MPKVDSVSLEDARRVIAVGEAKAREIGQPSNLAVVDVGGNLVAHARMEVNAGLREVIAAKDHQIAAAERRITVQDQRIAERERRLGQDSSMSNKPSSSDSPYRKSAPRSSRTSSGRKPGKQPGAPGATMGLVDDPDEIITCDPACGGGCGKDLSGAPVAGVERRQVRDVRPRRRG